MRSGGRLQWLLTANAGPEAAASVAPARLLYGKGIAEARETRVGVLQLLRPF
jgi:hypothetical protein